MSIWNKIKNLFNPKNLTTSQTQELLYAGQDPNSFTSTLLSNQDLLALSYFTKGVQIIASDIAKLNWTPQHWTPKGWINQEHTKIDFLLNRSPNKDLTAFEFKKMIVWNLFIYSKAPIYCHYTEGVDGKYRLIELIPIFPEWCKKEWNDSLQKYEYLLSTTPVVDGTPDTSLTKDITLRDDEIIWIDYEMIQGVMDISFKNLFKNSLNKLKENEIALTNAIKNDTGSSLIVKVPDVMNGDQREQIQRALDGAIAAQKKHGSVVFVGDIKWDIASGNLAASKIDFATRNAVGKEAASILGLPPFKLGLDDSNKYNTLAERHKAYVEESLRPIINNILSKLTNYFYPNDSKKRLNIRHTDLLSLDVKSLQDFAASAINNGYLTPNEVRALFGFQYHKDGDVLLANGSLTDIGMSYKKTKIEIDLMKKQLENKDEKPEQQEQQEQSENNGEQTSTENEIDEKVPQDNEENKK